MNTKYLDITGRRYGRLLVLRRAENRVSANGTQRAYWECLCDCGKIYVLQGANLKNGASKSCGCLRNEKSAIRNRARGPLLPAGTAGFRDLLRRYQRGARVRGLAWFLSADDFRVLTKNTCFYCGSPPKLTVWTSTVTQQVGQDGAYVYNGIDRVENALGYTLANCVTCCRDCNISKGTKTVAEFLAHIDRIAQHQASKTPAPSPDVDLPQVS